MKCMSCRFCINGRVVMVRDHYFPSDSEYAFMACCEACAIEYEAVFERLSNDEKSDQHIRETYRAALRTSYFADNNEPLFVNPDINEPDGRTNVDMVDTLTGYVVSLIKTN